LQKTVERRKKKPMKKDYVSVGLLDHEGGGYGQKDSHQEKLNLHERKGNVLTFPGD